MLDVRLLFVDSGRQILGLRFFNGDVDEAVASMHRIGDISWPRRGLVLRDCAMTNLSAGDDFS